MHEKIQASLDHRQVSRQSIVCNIEDYTEANLLTCTRTLHTHHKYLSLIISLQYYRPFNIQPAQ